MPLSTLATKIKEDVSKHLHKKTGKRWSIRMSEHFDWRFFQRLADQELEIVEKVIEKACEKAEPGHFRYTHPLYGITVVLNKMGLNGAELVTCWKEGK